MRKFNPLVGMKLAKEIKKINVNWKLLLILLLPFGTVILIGLILLKKIKKNKNSKT